MRHIILGGLIAACAIAGPSGMAAASTVTIDNFKRVGSSNQLLWNRQGSISPVQIPGTPNPVTETYTSVPGDDSVILGDVRTVTLTHISGDRRGMNVQFSRGRMALGVAERSVSSFLFEWNSDPFDIAALGSEFRLNHVVNTTARAGAKANNQGLPEYLDTGQPVTLTLLDDQGQSGQTTSIIPYRGTGWTCGVPSACMTSLWENIPFEFISFGMGDILSSNALLDLTRITGVTLFFDIDNASGFSESIYIGTDDIAGFTLTGDPYAFTAPEPGGDTPPVGVIPLPAAGWMLLTALAGLGLLCGRGAARRRA